MKICCPTKDGRIEDHFGHCAYYTIFTVENGQITAEETMASPEGCGCKSGIAPVLAEKGVIVMLGGNMGEGARSTLNANGIEVIRGCSGDVREVAEKWLKGELKDNATACSSHGTHSCPGH